VPEDFRSGVANHGGCVLLGPEAKDGKRRSGAALQEAPRAVGRYADVGKAALVSEFREILNGARLGIVYQPVVCFCSGEVLGWEALTRGPRDGPFASPEFLFGFAEEVGLLYGLEKICRRLALEGLGAMEPHQKVFLNIHPSTVRDPNFVRGETMAVVRQVGLRPDNVVFEVTERHCIKDFAGFDRALEHYRSQGYLVAVDDVGSGFSSLQSIAEIRPDFIKIDMALVRGINTNMVKRALVETFASFAEKIGSFVIVEGIETEEELVAVVATGAHYGQGYFLGRPAFPKPYPDREALTRVLAPAVSRGS